MSVHKFTGTQSNSDGNAGKLGKVDDNPQPQDPEKLYAFKDPPLKPNGSAWEVLLKPALEADTARCTAWKDEVQTLLIFAGLFSAVVTAFVIESYKFLQPDSNAAVIAILFHIAANLNNSNSSPFPLSVDQAAIAAPFSYTSSSVRINVFWFLSLILSLTTVLIGTISLQWLREHQSYPESSTKEKVVILHMRTEALEVWWVPQIFAALPVLLQAALALFLVGLVDFVLPLDRRLIISVAFVVGLTLFFLAATTVLPVLQDFLFLTGFYPYRTPPAPCAYKSPQSHAILAILSPPLRLLSYGMSCAYHALEGSKVPPLVLLRRYSVLIYLRKVLQQRTWAISDREWLDLRDGYHQCILDKDPGVYDHQDWWSWRGFPLHDVVRVLTNIAQETSSAKHTKEFLGAVVHCFDEVSKSVWTKFPTAMAAEQRKDRRSHYFEQLLSPSESSCSLSEWLIHGGAYKFNQVDRIELEKYIENSKTIIFHLDQMYNFLQLLLEQNSSPELEQYYAELWTHLNAKTSCIQPLKPGQTSFILPSIHIIRSTMVYKVTTFAKSNHQRYSTTARMLDVAFTSIASHRISQDQSLKTSYAQSDMVNIVSRLASMTDDYLQWAHSTDTPKDLEKQQFSSEINTQYAAIFKSVAEHLDSERARANANLNADDTPSLLFYLAAIFASELLWWRSGQDALSDQNSSFGQGLRSVLEALQSYKESLKGRKNSILETRYAKPKVLWNYTEMTGFTDKWWSVLTQRLDDVNEASRIVVVQENVPESRTVSSSEGRDVQKGAAAGVAVNTLSLTVPVPVLSEAVVPSVASLGVNPGNNTAVTTLSVYSIPNPINHGGAEVQQILSHSVTRVGEASATNILPDPTALNGHPSDPNSSLSSTDPDISGAEESVDEESFPEPAERYIPDEAKRQPRIVSSIVDTELPPAPTIGPHVIINVEVGPEVTGTTEASGVAKGPHTAINIKVLDDMPVKAEAHVESKTLSQDEPKAEGDDGGDNSVKA